MPSQTRAANFAYNFSNGADTGSWDFPEETLVDDATVATKELFDSVSGQDLAVEDWGFTLPEGAEVTDIKARVYCSVEGDLEATTEYGVWLYQLGDPTDLIDGFSPLGADQNLSGGSSPLLWDNSVAPVVFTRDLVNSSGFGLAVTSILLSGATSILTHCGYVELEVTYDFAPVAASGGTLAGGAGSASASIHPSGGMLAGGYGAFDQESDITDGAEAAATAIAPTVFETVPPVAAVASAVAPTPTPGSVTAEITDAAEVAAAAVDPTANPSLLPGVAEAAASALAPTVTATYTASPGEAVAIAAAVDVTALASLSPEVASAVAEAVTPAWAATFTSTPPVATAAAAAAVDPTWAATYTATPLVAEAAAVAIAPTHTASAITVGPGIDASYPAAVAIAPSVTSTFTVTVSDPAEAAAVVIDAGQAMIFAPDVVAATAVGIDPTPTLGSITATPGSTTAAASAVDPTASVGTASREPGEAGVVASAVDPTWTVGTTTIAPGVAEALGAAIDPTISWNIIRPVQQWGEAAAGAIDLLHSTTATASPGVADATPAVVSPTVIIVIPVPLALSAPLYKELRYTATGIPAANLVDYPKRFFIEDADIAAALAAGGGVRVTSADGLTDLPFGLYADTNLATGRVHFRAKFTLSAGASVGEVIGRIYYSADGSTVQNKSSVVTSGYAALQPLEAGSVTPPEVLDWTSNNADCTLEPDAATGPQFEFNTTLDLPALVFDGSNDYLSLPAFSPSELTWSAWIYRESTVGLQALFTNNATLLEAEETRIAWYPNTSSTSVFANFAIPAGSLQHIALTHSAANEWAIYVNGAIVGSGSTVAMDSTASGSFIGAYNGPSRFWNGKLLDPARASVVRSPEWIAYEYLDGINNAGTFTLGAEEQEADDLTLASAIAPSWSATFTASPGLVEAAAVAINPTTAVGGAALEPGLAIAVASLETLTWTALATLAPEVAAAAVASAVNPTTASTAAAPIPVVGELYLSSHGGRIVTKSHSGTIVLASHGGRIVINGETMHTVHTIGEQNSIEWKSLKNPITKALVPDATITARLLATDGATEIAGSACSVPATDVLLGHYGGFMAALALTGNTSYILEVKAIKASVVIGLRRVPVVAAYHGAE